MTYHPLEYTAILNGGPAHAERQTIAFPYPTLRVAGAYENSWVEPNSNGVPTRRYPTHIYKRQSLTADNQDLIIYNHVDTLGPATQ